MKTINVSRVLLLQQAKMLETVMLFWEEEMASERDTDLLEGLATFLAELNQGEDATVIIR